MDSFVVTEVEDDILSVVGEGWATAKEVSTEVACSKRHAIRRLKRFTENGLIERRHGTGWNGADEYRVEDTSRAANRVTKRELQMHRPCTFVVTEQGHVHARSHFDGESESVSMHRLLAVAEYGFEDVREMHVHHRNGIPWANWSENITLKEPSGHIREHWHGEPLADRIEAATKAELVDALEQAGYGQLASVLVESDGR